MINLQVGHKYKTKSGRLIEITKHCSEWNGGMFWGTSVDKKKPLIDHERWTQDARWWSYISPFSEFGYQELRNEEWDLVKEIIQSGGNWWTLQNNHKQWKKKYITLQE